MPQRRSDGLLKYYRARSGGVIQQAAKLPQDQQKQGDPPIFARFCGTETQSIRTSYFGGECFGELLPADVLGSGFYKNKICTAYRQPPSAKAFGLGFVVPVLAVAWPCTQPLAKACS